MDFSGSPLATSARRGLLTAGILLCGALVGSSVTAGALGKRLAALRGHRGGATHTAHALPPHATPKTPPAQLPWPSAAFPVDEPPQAPDIPQRSPPPADGDGKLVPPTSLPLMLSTLGAPTHDPRELVRRAERIIGEGAPISLLRSAVSLPAAGDETLGYARRATIVPLTSPPGVQFLEVKRGSFLDAAGLAQGDVVIAVNGYLIKRPENALAAYASARKAGSAVVELERQGKLVILEVTWISPPRPPIRR